MFFDSWQGLARIILIGPIAYIALIAMLRISGQRTLSKLNAFDLVVTVALGSVLATVILSKSIPLAEGITALALLIFLQFSITWMSVRIEKLSNMVKSEPALVFSSGKFLEEAMKTQRLTQDEVLSAIRASGSADTNNVAAVILETDGSLSVVKNAPGPALTAVVS